VILNAKVRVVSGRLKVGTARGQRIKAAAELPADGNGNRPTAINSSIPGPVNRVLLQAAEDDTVFDLRTG
jgi:hypothetical protein